MCYATPEITRVRSLTWTNWLLRIDFALLWWISCDLICCLYFMLLFFYDKMEFIFSVTANSNFSSCMKLFMRQSESDIPAVHFPCISGSSGQVYWFGGEKKWRTEYLSNIISHKTLLRICFALSCLSTVLQFPYVKYSASFLLMYLFIYRFYSMLIFLNCQWLKQNYVRNALKLFN